jgi:putative RNA 2'-phosphotransferase
MELGSPLGTIVERARKKSLSKLLSKVFRHRPEMVGVVLDPAGWVGVDELLAAFARCDVELTRDDLDEIVRTSDKQRFALSEDGRSIRANQGHSVEVELGHPALEPPAELFHGTIARFLESIRRIGLGRGSRHHVHLSENVETATRVGARRGKPVVLRIDARRMAASGFVFHRTPNGVWLTERVPAEYIAFPE